MYFDISGICQELGLSSSEWSNRPFNPNATNTLGVIIYHMYKNCVNRIIRTQKRFLLRDANPDMPIYDRVNDGTQEMKGFGGSTNVLGTNPPVPSHDNKNDAAVTFPRGQSFSVKRTYKGDDDCGLNEAMHDLLVKQGRVFMYFWEEQKLFGEDNKTKSLIGKRSKPNPQTGEAANVVRFVDYFVCDEFCQKRRTKEDILSEYDGFSNSVTKYVWFQLNKHSNFLCRPFFTEEDHVMIKKRAAQGIPYEVLRIPSDCNVTVDFDIKPGSAEKLGNITCKECMTLTDAYAKIIESGILDRYLVQPSIVDPTVLPDGFLDKVLLTDNSKGLWISGEELFDKDLEYDNLCTDDFEGHDQEILQLAQESLGIGDDISRNGVCDIERAILADFVHTVDTTISYQKHVHGMQLTDTAAVKGTCITFKELCLLALFVNAAGAFRYLKLGQCIRPDDAVEPVPNAGSDEQPPKKKRCPDSTNECSAPLMIETLGTALRLNTLPQCNRYLDTVPVALRREAIRCAWIPDSDEVPLLNLDVQENVKKLEAAIFAATCLRCTGRVARFAAYQQWAGNVDGSFLPKGGKDTDQFLAYVALTMDPKSATRPMTQWLSGQHVESIPWHLRKDFGNFNHFMTKMHATLSLHTANIIRASREQDTERGTRAAARHELTTAITHWLGNDSKGNVDFISQQVLADVEGLFGHLFGNVLATDVVGGHAGKLGYLMLVWRKDKSERMTFHAILDAIVEQVHDGTLANDDWLEIGGYKRKGDKVVNMVNGLLFTAIDAEHWLCKGWIVIKKTFNHYRNSKYPTPLEPHYHPIKWPGTGTPENITSDEVVDRVMMGITQQFNGCIGRTQVSGDTFTLPAVIDI